MPAADIDFPAVLHCDSCQTQVEVESQREARMELLACPNHYNAMREVAL